MKFSKNQKMIDMLNNFIDNISHSLSNKSVIKKSKKTFFDNMGTEDLAKPMYQKKMSIKKQSFTSPFNTSINQNNQQSRFKNHNQNNYQMSNTSSNSYGQNNYGQNNYNQKTNYGQKTNFNQGNYGQSNFNQGNYGQNSYGRTFRTSGAQNSDNLNRPYNQRKTIVNEAKITPNTNINQNINTNQNIDVNNQSRTTTNQPQRTVGTQTFANYMQAMNRASWDKLQAKPPPIKINIKDKDNKIIDPKNYTPQQKEEYNKQLKLAQENQKKTYNNKFKNYVTDYKTQQQNKATQYANRIAQAKLTGIIPPDLLQYFRG
jgi:hypothetical protein